MILVYSKANKTSMRIADILKEQFGFAYFDEVNGLRIFKSGEKELAEINVPSMDADFLDSATKTDCFVFLYSHYSTANVPAMTVHPEGNWSGDNSIGGRPHELGFASPGRMLTALHMLNKNRLAGVDVTYEATHHGPTIRTPSFFMEVGGTVDENLIDRMCGALARAAFDMFDVRIQPKQVALGIGGGHYPTKFTGLAIEQNVAFSHMMSKYNVPRLEMIHEAASKSDVQPSVAFIEWKSLKSPERNGAIEELEKIGLPYVRV